MVSKVTLLGDTPDIHEYNTGKKEQVTELPTNDSREQKNHSNYIHKLPGAAAASTQLFQNYLPKLLP